MRATLADHVLIAPTNSNALSAAIDTATTIRRCVLWLDDLVAYLVAGGLTRSRIGRILDGDGHHRVILATLRAAEEGRFSVDTDDGLERHIRKEARATLDQGYRIVMVRTFTQSERKRAVKLRADPRISEALAHADQYGIAEYIAAGPELMRDWENAWSPNTDPQASTHPRAAALIAAAVDIRRAGFVSPIPRGLLKDVHEHYLHERGGRRLRPESLEAAWLWATKPRRATTALLQPHDNQHIEVFDYLLDTIQRRSEPGNHVPDEVLRAVLAVCEPADAHYIGDTCNLEGRYQLAEIASFNKDGHNSMGSSHVAERWSPRRSWSRAIGRVKGYVHEVGKMGVGRPDVCHPGALLRAWPRL